MIITFFVIGMMTQAQESKIDIESLKEIEVSLTKIKQFDFFEFTEESVPILAIDGDEYIIPQGSYIIIDLKKNGNGNIKWVTISSMDDQIITLSFKDLVEVYKKKKILITRFVPK